MSVLIRPLSPMFSLNKTSPSSLREIRVRRGQNSRLKSNYVHNFVASSAYDLHFSSVRFSMKKIGDDVSENIGDSGRSKTDMGYVYANAN